MKLRLNHFNLRTEQRPQIRKQTISLLGLLGALDPYKHKINLGQIDTKGTENAPLIPINSEEDKDKEVSTSEMLVSNATLTLEEFYPSVAIATLMRIIRDPNLHQHHNQVRGSSFSCQGAFSSCCKKTFFLSSSMLDNFKKVNVKDVLLEILGKVNSLIIRGNR